MTALHNSADQGSGHLRRASRTAPPELKGPVFFSCRIKDNAIVSGLSLDIVVISFDLNEDSFLTIYYRLSSKRYVPPFPKDKLKLNPRIIEINCPGSSIVSH